ncbi:MAG: rhodanese-like domain-containing protein [Pyrinomonadaceae bacterium]
MFYESATPEEISEKIKNGGEIKFIDVREPHEYEIARIEAAELLPLSRFNEWIDKLKPEDEIVVMCHHGIRSANVCLFLVRNGFEKVFNLEGGIDLWSATVDENVPRY